MEITYKIILLPLLFAIVHCQLGFESNLQDSKFLDATEKLLSSEVNLSRGQVLNYMKSLDLATSEYISLKLKENVLRTVRALTGELLELEPIGSRRSWKKSLGYGRQDDVAEGAAEEASGSSSGGDAAEDTDDVEEPGTTELTGLGTAVQINQNVFKFLGDTVKILASGLGGGKVARGSLDQFLVSAESLMNERFSDQLLGLVVLVANESESQSSNVVQLKTVRGSHPKLQNVLVQSVKQALPLEEQVKGDTELNTFYFLETFRHSIDDILINKVAQKSESIPDLYEGVRGSFEVLKAMETFSAHLQKPE